MGTGSGFIDIWDMRFQLCIQGMRHPTGREEKKSSMFLFI